MAEELSLPELTDFDDKAIRKLVRRAIIRTAATTAVWLLLAVLVLNGASKAWSARDAARFAMVYGQAYSIANPAYSVTFDSGGRESVRSRWDFGSEYRGQAQAHLTGHGFGPAMPISIRRDAAGKVTEATLLPETPISKLPFGWSKEYSSTALDRLPAYVRTSAVINTARPMTVEEFGELRVRNGLCAPMSSFSPLTMQEEAERTKLWLAESKRCRFGGSQAQLGTLFLEPDIHDRDLRSTILREGHRRVTWEDPFLLGLENWAGSLRKSDDYNLREVLHLPGSSEIKRLAKEKRIYGFILTNALPSELRGLIGESEIKAVAVTGVELDLDAGLNG